jgi:hypothetical protein
MLRIEGHVALWVVAFACVAGTLLRPTASERVAALPVGKAAVSYIAATSVSSVSFQRVLPDLPTGGRPLFDVAEVGGAPPPAVAGLALPVLRGVISDGLDVRAVLATNSGTLTAMVSDVVSDYRIESIDADQVILVGPDGRTETLKLRGSGELP